MKITNEHVARLLEARLERIQRTQQAHPHSRPDAAKPDRAIFSGRSEDLRAALTAARTAARAAAGTEDPRLASLAEQVRAGRYHVPTQDIAHALLRECHGAFGRHAGPQGR